MKREEVEANLRDVRLAREEFRRIERTFRSNIDAALSRLIYEAARNYMSAQDVATASGIPLRDVRARMRSMGMDPKRGKYLLAKTAADALHENAALLGVDPSEMDFMSPLAYLPMGEELRKRLTRASIHDVHELPEEL